MSFAYTYLTSMSAQTVSWVSADAVVNAIVEVAFSECMPIALNIAHPRPVEWNSTAVSLASAISEDKELLGHHLPVIPFPEWFAVLERKAQGAKADNITSMVRIHLCRLQTIKYSCCLQPAIKLLEFFRGLAFAEHRPTTESGGLSVFSTKKVRGSSATMRELEPIGSHDVRKWVKYWKAVGFLDTEHQALARS